MYVPKNVPQQLTESERKLAAAAAGIAKPIAPAADATNGARIIAAADVLNRNPRTSALREALDRIEVKACGGSSQSATRPAPPVVVHPAAPVGSPWKVSVATVLRKRPI